MKNVIHIIYISLLEENGEIGLHFKMSTAY